MVDGKSLPGFGSRCSRFNCIGIHPGRLKDVNVTSHSGIGPGSYDHKSLMGTDAKDHKGGWKKQMERWSKIPYFACKEKERELAEILGPGRYFVDVNRWNKRNIQNKGLVESGVPRFESFVLDRGCPGPGYYDMPKDITRRKDFGTIGQLSSGSKRMNDRNENIGISPGMYEIKGSIDELLTKRSGSRGPYHSFASDTNRHKTFLVTNDLGPGQYDVTLDSFKKSGGKFSQLRRQCETSFNNFPGPEHYFPKAISSIGSSSAPFMCNTSRSRLIANSLLQGNSGVVGPGRYDINKNVRSTQQGRRN